MRSPLRAAILPRPMRRSSTRIPAALLTLGLFLATGIGVPVHHHADHHGGDVHVTADGHTHGHGSTLIVRDMRTERPASSVELPGALPVDHPPFATTPVAAVSSPPVLLARGRSPPSAILPRAPPHTS